MTDSTRYKKTNINKPIPKMSSDLYFKRNMTNVTVARDFLTFNLPEGIKSQIQLASLSLAPQEILTAALRRKVADVVYTVKLAGDSDEVGFLIVHVEQQTKPQRLMPLRMLEFMTTIMRQYTENQASKDETPIPVVIPIILSNHGGKYPYSTRFLDLFTETGQALVSPLLNDDIPLIDLSSMPDETIKNHLSAAIMEMALKNIKGSSFEYIFTSCVNLLKLLISEEKVSELHAREILQDLVYFVVDNIKEVPSVEDTDDLFATATHELPNNTGEMLMTLREQFEERGMQRGMQRGIEQGIEQGMQRGIEQGIRAMIKRMFDHGFSEQQICACANVSSEALAKIKESLHDVDNQDSH